MLSKRLNKQWLLSELDQSVKRMVKLIEEDADSFEKRAQMFYKKRPELMSHVEEFYHKYRSLAERYDHDIVSARSSINNLQAELVSLTGRNVELQEFERDLEGSNTDSEAESLDLDNKMQELLENIRITEEKLGASEAGIASLKQEIETGKYEKIGTSQNQLEMAHKDVATWKPRVMAVREEVSKLKEILMTSLTDHDVSDAAQNIILEKEQLKAEMSSLIERTRLEEQLQEWEQHGSSLDEKVKRIMAEKTKMEERLRDEIKQLKADILERDNCIQDLNRSLDALKCEREGRNAEILKLQEDLMSRNDRTLKMEKRLDELRMEREQLNGNAKEARELIQKLRPKITNLEAEIERRRVLSCLWNLCC